MVSHLLSSCSNHHIPSVIDQSTDEETRKVLPPLLNHVFNLFLANPFTS
jgi:hypothetical protein